MPLFYKTVNNPSRTQAEREAVGDRKETRTGNSEKYTYDAAADDTCRHSVGHLWLVEYGSVQKLIYVILGIWIIVSGTLQYK